MLDQPQNTVKPVYKGHSEKLEQIKLHFTTEFSVVIPF